jgi:hypothetical protein
MSSIQEISTPKNFRVWLSQLRPDSEIKFDSGRLAKCERGKSIASIVKGNIKAALDNGLTIRAIKVDGEIMVGDMKESKINDWDEILPGDFDSEE